MNTTHALVFAAQLVVLLVQARWTQRAWRLVKRAAFAVERANETADQLEAVVMSMATQLDAAVGRCGVPMSKGDLPEVRCCLAPRHLGDHAASWHDLTRAGYVKPPF